MSNFKLSIHIYYYNIVTFKYYDRQLLYRLGDIMMELNEILYEMFEICPYCGSEKLVGKLDSTECLDCKAVFQ